MSGRGVTSLRGIFRDFVQLVALKSMLLRCTLLLATLFNGLSAPDCRRRTGGHAIRVSRCHRELAPQEPRRHGDVGVPAGGLARDPAARFSSLTDLLRALRSAASQRRRTITLGVAALAVVAAATSFLGVHRREAAQCDVLTAPLVSPSSRASASKGDQFRSVGAAAC